MKTIILDLGSGNSCKNDINIVYEMIDSVPKDSRIIIKWQLFQKAGDNIPLDKQIFTEAYSYARNKGILTTASVFDIPSLDFLLSFDHLPFIKIANNPSCYPLISRIPRGIPVYVSWDGFYTSWEGQGYNLDKVDVKMACVSKYPAQDTDYYRNFSKYEMGKALSDHTISNQLVMEINPEIYECHLKLPGMTGLDTGAFARYPWDIKNLIESR